MIVVGRPVVVCQAVSTTFPSTPHNSCGLESTAGLPVRAEVNFQSLPPSVQLAGRGRRHGDRGVVVGAVVLRVRPGGGRRPLDIAGGGLGVGAGGVGRGRRGGGRRGRRVGRAVGRALRYGAGCRRPHRRRRQRRQVRGGGVRRGVGGGDRALALAQGDDEAGGGDHPHEEPDGSDPACACSTHHRACRHCPWSPPPRLRRGRLVAPGPSSDRIAGRTASAGVVPTTAAGGPEGPRIGGLRSKPAGGGEAAARRARRARWVSAVGRPRRLLARAARSEAHR